MRKLKATKAHYDYLRAVRKYQMKNQCEGEGTDMVGA